MRHASLLLLRTVLCCVQLANHGGLTPLHEATAGGHKEAAEALLSVGATTDAVDQVHSTPWHHLVRLTIVTMITITVTIMLNTIQMYGVTTATAIKVFAGPPATAGVSQS